MKKFDVTEWADRHRWQVFLLQLVIAIIAAIFIFPYYNEWQRGIDGWQRLLFVIGCLSTSAVCFIVSYKIKSYLRGK